MVNVWYFWPGFSLIRNVSSSELLLLPKTQSANIVTLSQIHQKISAQHSMLGKVTKHPQLGKGGVRKLAIFGCQILPPPFRPNPSGSPYPPEEEKTSWGWSVPATHIFVFFWWGVSFLTDQIQWGASENWPQTPYYWYLIKLPRHLTEYRIWRTSRIPANNKHLDK